MNDMGGYGTHLEPVTGIGPALPAWKAGALPLSYTDVVCPGQRMNDAPGLPVFPGRQKQKEEDLRRVTYARVEPLVGFEPTAC